MNIVSLAREYDRKRFDCGDDSVTAFLRESAFHDQKLLLSRTSVLIDEHADATIIVGFHTLLVSTVDQESIPDDKPRIKRKIPVILLGQLGVDLEFQGRNFGNLLLTDVEFRVAEISKHVGIRCLALDARNERLAKWYEKRGFVRFHGSLRMFKSVQDVTRFVSSG